MAVLIIMQTILTSPGDYMRAGDFFIVIFYPENRFDIFCVSGIIVKLYNYIRQRGILLERGKSKYNALLLLAAIIWGFAFVAQSEGMKHIGPFTLNGIRFALGSLCILPVILISSKKNGVRAGIKLKNALIPGLITGTVLFAGAFLQTLGISYTTVGKAAFITGLYIVFVPVTGIFLKHSCGLKVWLSAGIAALGLYLLCVQEDLTIGTGDLLVLVSAVLFTAHILFIDKYSKCTDVFTFAFMQAAVASVLNLITAFIFEEIKTENIMRAAIPLLYGGILSAGVAFTLQVIGQKHAKPAHASLIMSLETVFAAFAGWVMLNEHMVLREYIGCFLMLSGTLVTQIPNRKKCITVNMLDNEPSISI